ncbi:MAG: TonB-dependent receptor plug domain-containing protein [Bacteroidales bacterium]|nr:TonB-dependent receptor plug domain-containing protein [Bacteroidales bacterium]
MYKVKLGLLACCVLCSMWGYAQEDSVTIHTLKNFTVYGTYVDFNVPGKQKIDVQDYFKNAMQASEVVKFFSGVNMKDYGGIGGLKTVSIRGLGANHTAVSLDGVPLTDCQTGQIDLGKLSLANVDYISILNANSETDIFKSARLFSAANTLQVHTHEPQFQEGKPCNVSVGVKISSATTFNPYLLLEGRLSQRWSTALCAEYLYSKGNYKYVMHYGGADDSTSVERRVNGDVSAVTAVWNLFYNDSSNHFHFKAYAYSTRNGLPGATILYNLEASQRLNNDMFFLQATYSHHFKHNISYKCVLKANYAHTEYIDTTFWNSEGGLDNHYQQRELYLSNVLLYAHPKQWQVSLSNDIVYNNMSLNMKNFPLPHRVTVFTNAATTYRYKWWRMQANILHTYVYDITRLDNERTHYSQWSPAVNMEFKLLPKEKFTLSIGYQYVFRLPTFNDLYYTSIGNRSLKPETLHQAVVTLAWVKNIHLKLPYFRMAVSGYYHRVNNKIVAIPTRNLFLWSMYNYGKVNVAGLDANMDMQVNAARWLRIDMSLNYSYQRAVDVTSADSKTYRHQIPYTPQHSGNARIIFNTTWFSLYYTLQIVGGRYRLGQNIPQNYLAPYYDHSMGISTDFHIKQTMLTVGADVLNMSNKNYEIVANFPVQGISWRVNLAFKW